MCAAVPSDLVPLGSHTLTNMIFARLGCNALVIVVAGGALFETGFCPRQYINFQEVLCCTLLGLITLTDAYIIYANIALGACTRDAGGALFEKARHYPRQHINL